MWLVCVLVCVWWQLNCLPAGDCRAFLIGIATKQTSGAVTVWAPVFVPATSASIAAGKSGTRELVAMCYSCVSCVPASICLLCARRRQLTTGDWTLLLPRVPPLAGSSHKIAVACVAYWTSPGAHSRRSLQALHPFNTHTVHSLLKQKLNLKCVYNQ